MHLTDRSLAALAACMLFVAASPAQSITLQRQPAAPVQMADGVLPVQYGGGFPVWGGFGNSPRGRPFVAGRPYGSSWWSPRNDYYAGRRYYGPRFYYGARPYYGSRYYSRRDLRRSWR